MDTFQFTNRPPADLKDQIDGEGVVFRIEPMEKYLAQDQFISAGKLHSMLTKTPKQFLYDWQTEAMLRKEGTEQDETAATILGSAMHTLILEEQNFNNEFIIFDPANRPEQDKGMTSKINRDWKAKFKAQAQINERTLLKIEDFDIVFNQATAVKDHPIASNILHQKGITELSIYTMVIWGDKSFYVRIRPDRVLYEKPNFIDLKRSRDASPQEFARDAGKFGYDMKMALYKDILSYHWLKLMAFLNVDVTPANEALKHSIIIAVDNTAPYDVGIYPIPEVTHELGQYRYRAALDRFGRALEFQKWPGYEIYSEDRGLIPLILPPWYSKEIVI